MGGCWLTGKMASTVLELVSFIAMSLLKISVFTNQFKTLICIVAQTCLRLTLHGFINVL